MAGSNSKAKREDKGETRSDPAVSYNEFKEFEGQKYTGMKVGRSHKWYYDQGEWKEKKITPDLWELSYAVTKRRAGRAPEGSGVPVDTEYHWYILAHQNVRKLNANDYTTSMTGLKFKIAPGASRQTSGSTFSLEVLHRALMLLGLFPGLEGAKVLTLSGLGILLARVQAILPRFELADHPDHICLPLTWVR